MEHVEKDHEHRALILFYEGKLREIEQIIDESKLRRYTYKQLHTRTLEHLAELYFQANQGGCVLKRVLKPSKINKN